MISMHVEDLKIRVSMYVNISKRYSCRLTKLYSPRHLLQDYQMYPGEIDKACATDDDRSEQETIVYTISQRDNKYSQPVLGPDYGNVLVVYISPLNNQHDI